MKCRVFLELSLKEGIDQAVLFSPAFRRKAVGIAPSLVGVVAAYDFDEPGIGCVSDQTVEPPKRQPDGGRRFALWRVWCHVELPKQAKELVLLFLAGFVRWGWHPDDSVSVHV